MYEDCPDCVHGKSRRIQTALTQRVSLSRPLGTRWTHKSQLYFHILATDSWKLKLKTPLWEHQKPSIFRNESNERWAIYTHWKYKTLMRENKDLETQSVSWFKRLSIIENSTFLKWLIDSTHSQIKSQRLCVCVNWHTDSKCCVEMQKT